MVACARGAFDVRYIGLSYIGLYRTPKDNERHMGHLINSDK